MIAVDTSVVVAAFASWHEGHTRSIAVLARRPRVPAHVLVETFSVLTRLPAPHRAPAGHVTEFLAAHFQGSALALPAGLYPRLLAEAATVGIAGGALYDALVAVTARHAGATLVTRDLRARGVYERPGVQAEFIA